jgi:predicted AlkP superfamily pyrophosphatase or phosphodiesterase
MSETNRRVLVFGADGLRPDLIDRQLMPNLVKLAEGGVQFSDHHAAYPSHTRVNASTFATGATPGRHGIVANTMLVPDATDDHIVDTSNYLHLDAMARNDPQGAQLVESLSDVLVRHGYRLGVAGTGSSGSNVLWTFGDRGRIVNPNSAFGIADLYDLREKLGAIPEKAIPAGDPCRYATRAVTEIYLQDPTIRVITLWLAEPDSSFHARGLGSPEACQSLEIVDECLGMVLQALDQRGIRDQFDILFLSDHGHSTVETHKSLREYLVDARRDLGSHLPPLATASDFIYAEPGTPEPTVDQLAPLVEWLQAQPWVDVVLGGVDGSEQLTGVLRLADLWNGQTNHRRPVLAVSPVWSNELNEFGVPGKVAALTTQAALKSSHGSLSPFDMHSTFIANGPSFQEGFVSTLATGGMDIMPTILSILGLNGPGSMDGRVVGEALVDSGIADFASEDIVLEPAGEGGRVLLHKVGATTYVHGSLQGVYTNPSPQAATSAIG